MDDLISIFCPAFDERLTASSGVLKSKNYPGGFPPNSDSVWQISVEVGYMINLRIIELRIPVASQTGCYGDYLNIIEGDTSQSPLITKICHSQSNVGVASTGESLRIELHSGNAERRGDVDQPTRFHAHYSQRGKLGLLCLFHVSILPEQQVAVGTGAILYC